MQAVGYCNSICCNTAFALVMSIGNHKFGIPKNTNTKSEFGIYVQNLLVYFWYFIDILSTVFIKCCQILVFFSRIQIG